MLNKLASVRFDYFRWVLFFCGFIVCFAAQANNPHPFGLEVGKSTIAELHRHYHINSVEKYTNFGKIFYITTSHPIYPHELNVNVKKVGLSFDEHGTLELIEVIIAKDYFTKMDRYLSQNYIKSTYKADPLHDHYSLYESGNCDVFIISSLEEENIHVVYATKTAHEKYNRLVPHPSRTL